MGWTQRLAITHQALGILYEVVALRWQGFVGACRRLVGLQLIERLLTFCKGALLHLNALNTFLQIRLVLRFKQVMI